MKELSYTKRRRHPLVSGRAPTAAASVSRAAFLSRANPRSLPARVDEFRTVTEVRRSDGQRTQRRNHFQVDATFIPLDVERDALTDRQQDRTQPPRSVLTQGMSSSEARITDNGPHASTPRSLPGIWVCVSSSPNRSPGFTGRTWRISASWRSSSKTPPTTSGSTKTMCCASTACAKP
jgi:hypothetical protein